MHKIPTLYVRSTEDRRFVIPQVAPGCDWVLAGEGVATRKFDGTCVLFDPQLDPSLIAAEPALQDWWTRREVKPGAPWPAYFIEVEHDEVTGKTVGWEPADRSPFARYLAQAVGALTDGPEVGTHELIGPKINRNPEHAERHTLVRHDDADILAAPRSYDALCRWLLAQPYEGVVFHRENGDMAKLKRRDVRA